MQNYMEQAKTFLEEELVLQIGHTREMLRKYRVLYKESDIADYQADENVNELEARLTAYVQEHWNRRYPANRR